MRLKIFRAASMNEAMAQLRAELGPEALILGARTLKHGVEITGALDPEEARPVPPPPPDRQPAARPPWTRAPLRSLQALIDHHGIPEATARRLAGEPLPSSLARLLRFAPIAAQAGPLLFTGPPGAGKTSTVARLATRLVLDRQHPLVITTDGRRAGATEQLAAYTRLLGLNLVVATHPAALARVLARREADEAVLIDAAGADTHDPGQMDEIAALAGAADARLALVLPAGLDQSEAVDIAMAHAAVGASLLVTTRLDLCRRLGSVIAVGTSRALALCEAGIGPGAADGLVAMTPALLAERLTACLPTEAVQPPTSHPAALPSSLPRSEACA